MFNIPSQCNFKSSEMKYSSSDKKKQALKENKVNPKLGFTPAVCLIILSILTLIHPHQHLHLNPSQNLFLEKLPVLK